MRKLVVVLLLCFTVSGLSNNAAASFWSSTPLVTINEQEFSQDDYKNWWRHWNNKNELPVPADLSEYIDFQLMVQQALAMEYDQHPAFVRTTGVYLKFRSLMAMKYEEVDSKVKISESEERAYFEEFYAPLWRLQVLAFDDKEEAEKVYAQLQPFNGQEVGRLIFADLQGVGSLPFEEVEVSPFLIRRNKRDAWLPIIRELKPGFMAEPFLESEKGKYVLLRLVSISQPDKSLFDELRGRIRHNLTKRKVGEFTSGLHRELIEKYGLSVDDDLAAEIDPDKEYSDDFLQQTIIRIGDTEVSVEAFVRNIRLEIKRRPGVTRDFVINLVKNDLSSQILLEKESLARHYEEQDPFKDTWEFYRQNQLRLTLTRELDGREKIIEGEALSYFDGNKKLYVFSATEKYVKIISDQESVNRAWTDIVHGGDVLKVAKAYGLPAEIIEEKKDSISPEWSEVLKKLKEGGVSKPIKYGDDYALIVLVASIPERAHSFNEVKAQIETKLLKEKRTRARAAYLQEVRSRSSIEINDKKWQKLREEL